MRSMNWIAGALFWALLAIAGSAFGQCLIDNYTEFNPRRDDQFGTWLDIEGDLAAVGAWLEDEQGQNSGAIYIYERGPMGWMFTERILRPDGGSPDEIAPEFWPFGECVALQGNTALIGAPLTGNPDGDGQTSPDANGNGLPDECDPLTLLVRVDTPPTSGGPGRRPRRRPGRPQPQAGGCSLNTGCNPVLQRHSRGRLRDTGSAGVPPAMKRAGSPYHKN